MVCNGISKAQQRSRDINAGALFTVTFEDAVNPNHGNNQENESVTMLFQHHVP